MAISGTLDELDVAGVLQLVSTHGKSGTLEIRNAEGAEVHLLFEDGEIVGSDYSQRGEKQRIGELLVKAELLTAKQLEEALETQKRKGARLGELLVRTGAIRKQDLADMLRVQVYETAFRCFQWRQGDFEFKVGPVDYERELVQPIRTSLILMDGSRMVDEWPQVKKFVPSFDRIVQKTEAGAQVHRPDEDAEETEDDPDLEDYEWVVLELTEQNPSVQRLIYRSRLGEFEACKALMGLQEKGLVRLVSTADLTQLSAPTIEIPREHDKRGGRVIGNAAVVLVAAGAVVAMLVLNVLQWSPGSRGGLSGDAAAIGDLLVEARARTVRNALDLYAIEHGQRPGEIDALVEAGLVSGLDLQLVSGRFEYDVDSPAGLVPRAPAAAGADDPGGDAAPDPESASG